MDDELVEVGFELFACLPNVVRIRETFSLAPVRADLGEGHVVQVSVECRVDNGDRPRLDFRWGAFSLLDKR